MKPIFKLILKFPLIVDFHPLALDDIFMSGILITIMLSSDGVVTHKHNFNFEQLTGTFYENKRFPGA